MASVRWCVTVPQDLDLSVRSFLAAQGGSPKGGLSRLIQEAVCAYLLGNAAEQAKEAASELSEASLNSLIDDAVQ